MTMHKKHIVLKTAPDDNIGIVADPKGLPVGITLDNGIKILQNIPAGQKVALCNIGQDKRIIRYGHTIGHALRSIEKGDWVKESDISLPVPPELHAIPLPDNHLPEPEPLEGYTFEGYRNPDGTVGTKNILGITTSVQCVAGLTQYVADKIRKELLPQYTNVDGVVPLNHTYGCGVAIEAPGAIVPIRTIRNISQNPNFGGELLIIGLGCEKLRPETLLSQRDNGGSEDNDKSSDILYLQDESFHGFNEMVVGIMQLAESHLKKLNQRERETCPASDLVVGMQCGGSDAFSGLTANPTVGFAADLIVRAGGSVMFSEVTEVRDAVHLLVPRVASMEVAETLLEEMQWYDDYLLQGQADRSDNTTPGNKKGGLSNIVEKALGSITKSGTSTIVDVLKPGERIRRKGLTFAATPASDFVCGTLQLAAGMNMHIFTTGRGTPYGLAMVPVIKVGSNSALSQRWFDLIDLDAGSIATGEKTIEDMGWELFYMILEVASGHMQVASDRFGLYNDLVLFNPGPLT